MIFTNPSKTYNILRYLWGIFRRFRYFELYGTVSSQNPFFYSNSKKLVLSRRRDTYSMKVLESVIRGLDLGNS